MPAPSPTNPIVLAFSGGLDTSFCIPWLAETHGRPVVTVTVDTGGLDATAAASLAERSRALGAADHLLIDARERFFDRILRFLIFGNVRRGQVYPLCVGAERLIQAQEVAAAAACSKRANLASQSAPSSARMRRCTNGQPMAGAFACNLRNSSA